MTSSFEVSTIPSQFSVTLVGGLYQPINPQGGVPKTLHETHEKLKIADFRLGGANESQSGICRNDESNVRTRFREYQSNFADGDCEGARCTLALTCKGSQPGAFLGFENIGG